MFSLHPPRSHYVAAAVGAFLISGCNLANIQEPHYVTQVRDGAFEVRSYGPRVVAETTVAGGWSDAGNEGFRRLAGYIFGKNGGRAKIAMTAPVAQTPQKPAEQGVKLPMTAPVAQQRQGDSWAVAFTMPEGETLRTLPAPADPRVVLREVPPARVAVVRFSGRWTDANIKEHEATLRRWTKEQHLTTTGEAEVNRYDPPFKPWFLRRNEVWLQISEGAKN
jgi:SOUL heme-binding protein